MVDEPAEQMRKPKPQPVSLNSAAGRAAESSISDQAKTPSERGF